MTVRADIYTDELIDAIDDWQAGSKDKATKAARLMEASAHLPPNYRRVTSEVYRQLRANARLAYGIASDAMPDYVSSWTTSLEVARHFREKDGDRTKVLMIFRRLPAEGEVILNLNVVYAEPDFMETVRAAEARPSRPYKGITRWQGSQKEVILNETVMMNDDIIALGAYRELSDVVPVIGAPTRTDVEVAKDLSFPTPSEHFWTSPESAANGIREAGERVRDFLKSKQIWPGQRT